MKRAFVVVLAVLCASCAWAGETVSAGFGRVIGLPFAISRSAEWVPIYDTTDTARDSSDATFLYEIVRK